MNTYIQLILEYWEGSLPLKILSGDYDLWESSPKEGIVRVGVRYFGLRPGKTHTTILSGSDYYYLYSSNNNLVFGGWTDPKQSWAVAGRVGREFILTPNNTITTVELVLPPMDPTTDWVKLGVMLPEDQAIEIGLIGNETPPASGRPCCG